MLNNDLQRLIIVTFWCHVPLKTNILLDKCLKITYRIAEGNQKLIEFMEAMILAVLFFFFSANKLKLFFGKEIPSAGKIADVHSESENRIIQRISVLCKPRSTIFSAAPSQLTSGILSGLLVIQLTSADE